MSRKLKDSLKKVQTSKKEENIEINRVVEESEKIELLSAQAHMYAFLGSA